MSCLGEMTPNYVVGTLIDGDLPVSEDDDTWENVWNHYHDLLVVRRRANDRSPPDNWNQHFASTKRIARYGLMFTPVEENGFGSIQLRKCVDGEDIKYSAKYIRTGELIEKPHDVPADGRSTMEYLVSAYIPQAVEECVTVIGYITGRGQFSGITGYETVRIPMEELGRKKMWCDIRDLESLSWIHKDTEGHKVNPDPEDELSWYKSDRRDLQEGGEPRVVPNYPDVQLSKTALKNSWFPECSKAVSLITASVRGKKKTQTSQVQQNSTTA